MGTITLLTIAHSITSIYVFTHFGRYLTNNIFYIGFNIHNCSWIVYIDLWHLITSQKEVTCQIIRFCWIFHATIFEKNFLTKLLVAVWHVAPSRSTLPDNAPRLQGRDFLQHSRRRKVNWYKKLGWQTTLYFVSSYTWGFSKFCSFYFGENKAHFWIAVLLISRCGGSSEIKEFKFFG